MRRNYITFVLMMLSAAISAGFSIPLFTLFVGGLGASLALIGIIILGRSVLSTFSRMPVGDLSDRWGRKPILLLGTGCYTIAPLAYSFISTPTYLLPFAIIQGLGIAALWTTSFAAVADISPHGKRGQALGVFSLVPGTGYSTGAILGGILSSGNNYVLNNQIGFILGAFSFVVCLIGFKETHKRSENIVSSSDPSKNAFTTYIRLLRNPIILMVAIGGLAGSLTLHMALTFFPLFGDQIGLSGALIALILTAKSFLGGSLMAPVIGKLADRFDQIILLMFFLLLSLIVVAIIPLMTSFLIFFTLFFLLGLVDSGIQIIPMALIADSDDIPGKGLGLGVVKTSNNMGRVVSPLLFSLLAGTQSIAYSFWASCIITGIILVVMFPLVRSTRTRINQASQKNQKQEEMVLKPIKTKNDFMED